MWLAKEGERATAQRLHLAALVTPGLGAVLGPLPVRMGRLRRQRTHQKAVVHRHVTKEVSD